VVVGGRPFAQITQRRKTKSLVSGITSLEDDSQAEMG